MSDGAAASPKLTDRFPQASVLTDLTGKLKDGMGGVKAPGMPGDQIQNLSSSLQLPIPDSSTWHTAIPDDAKGLMGNFPNPADLAKPITDPIGKVKDVFSFDFSKFQQNQSTAPSTAPGAAAPADIISTVEALAGPVEDAVGLLADPELGRILEALGTLTGVQEIKDIPKQAQAAASEIKTILHDDVEGIILGFVTLVSAHSTQDVLQRRVAAATGTFSLADTQSRLQAALDQYTGGTALAALVSAADPSDAAGMSTLSDRLTAAQSSFQTYTGSLTRDLALTEVALALLDTADLEKQWQQMQAAVSKVDWSAANSLSSLVAAEVQKIKDKLTIDTGFTLDQYKQSIQAGVAELDQLIDKFDPSQVVQAIQNAVKTVLSPLQKLEDFKTQVETIVRGALGTVRDAIQKINIKPLTDMVKQALATLGDSLKKIAAVLNEIRQTIQTALDTVKKALDGVKTFVLDPQHGLKKEIEDVFHGITAVLDELKIQDVVNEIKALLKPVNDALAKIEFKPIIDAVLQAIDTITGILQKVAPLLVSDALKQKLAEAAAFLNQIDFGKIGGEVTAVFDEILASVNQDALGAFQAEYEQVVAAMKNLDPEPALQEVQKEVFDPLLAELEKVHPADLLKPVNDAFTAAHQELAKFNPTETFSFMTGFFKDLIAKIEEISPAKLLAPVEKMLDDLRQQIDSLLHIDAIVAAFAKFQSWVKPVAAGLDLFGPVLDGLSAGHQQMRDAIANFDTSVFTKVIANIMDSALSRLGAAVNAAGLSGAISAIASGPADLGQKLAQMQQTMNDSSSQLAGLDAQAALTALRARYSEVKAAVAARTGAALPAAILATVDSLDPMPVLAPILPKIDRVKAAAANKASQFGQMAAPFTAVLKSLEGAVSLLHTLLSPLTILRDVMMAPIQGLFPGQHFAGPKDVLLYFLDQFNPGDLRPIIEPLLKTVEAKLKALVDDAVLKPVGEVVQTIKGATELLNIHSLVDAVDGVFKDVESAIQSLDPTPLIQEINTEYQQIVAMLDQVNPAQFIQEIAKIYDEDIVGVIKAISPEGLLLPPLRELFQKIGAALGAFDIQAIFKPVLDRLQGLDTDLGGGLKQVEGSWQQLLAVLASTTGGGDSASVSVSAQAA